MIEIYCTVNEAPKRDSEPKTHVFFKACGCLSCAIVNVPNMFGELAKAQRYAQKHGDTYRLMETQDVREMPFKCPQHQKVEEKAR